MSAAAHRQFVAALAAVSDRPEKPAVIAARNRKLDAFVAANSDVDPEIEGAPMDQEIITSPAIETARAAWKLARENADIAPSPARSQAVESSIEHLRSTIADEKAAREAEKTRCEKVALEIDSKCEELTKFTRAPHVEEIAGALVLLNSALKAMADAEREASAFSREIDRLRASIGKPALARSIEFYGAVDDAYKEFRRLVKDAFVGRAWVHALERLNREGLG